MAEESREDPAVLRQSRRQLHESVLREQQLAREREQELQVLRARVLVLENRLSPLPPGRPKAYKKEISSRCLLVLPP